MSTVEQSPTVPQHIAIVCDGNRRWARGKGLPTFLGHKQAVDAVMEPLIDHAAARGVKYLTFWIFSTENWSRDKEEVEGLMNLFRMFFDDKVKSMDKKGVRFKMIGDITGFAVDIQDRILRGVADTAQNTRITVTLAMNYGGRDELIRTFKKIAAQVESGDLFATDITEEIVGRHLDTAGVPDPDFVIRTSGEQRLSGYLLWQLEYAELYFPKFHFPEFTPERLDEAIEEFQQRHRRFGK
jgi:undecaprenyl diphosphate synthase